MLNTQYSNKLDMQYHSRQAAQKNKKRKQKKKSAFLSTAEPLPNHEQDVA